MWPVVWVVVQVEMGDGRRQEELLERAGIKFYFGNRGT